MSNNTKFLAGILAGVGIGTMIGLLIAPDKGTNTYKKLEGAVKEAVNDLTDVSNDMLKNAQKKAESVAKKAS
jgi:gas vesicle protein